MTVGRERPPDELERDLLELELPEEPAAAPRPELRASVLAISQGRLDGFVRRLAAFLDLGAERARELVGQVPRVSLAPWVDDRVSGVRLLHFDGGPRRAGADCGLVHVAPGVVYPRHRHRGEEWSFVLHGSALEDSGRVLAPGDLVHHPAGSRHSFQALGREPFVFAVVLREGIEFDERRHET